MQMGIIVNSHVSDEETATLPMHRPRCDCVCQSVSRSELHSHAKEAVTFKPTFQASCSAVIWTEKFSAFSAATQSHYSPSTEQDHTHGYTHGTHTQTHILLTFKAYRRHLYPSPLIPVVLQWQQVCRPLLKTTPRTHMHTQRHAHKHTHRVTCSLSGRTRPYASFSLQLHICLIAVNRRSRCFHMDTQRADSDPCAT